MFNKCKLSFKTSITSRKVHYMSLIFVLNIPMSRKEKKSSWQDKTNRLNETFTVWRVVKEKHSDKGVKYS